MDKYDAIKYILRNYSSREEPITMKGIIDEANKENWRIGRTVIEGVMNDLAIPYETEEQCDEIIKNWRQDNQSKRELIFQKQSKGGRRTRGYWMLESISNCEWMFLMDSVLYSKILTTKEANNLAQRICKIAGRDLKEITKYRTRMREQPYFYGDNMIDNKACYIESRVLRQVYLIRKAITNGKKVKFDLNVYKYCSYNKGKQLVNEVRLVPYGKFGRKCSAFDIIYSNGRYYMLGADSETEKRNDLKYKLYRIDLMTNISIIRATAQTKQEAGIDDLNDLFTFRIENPYMFGGNVQRVKLRVDSEQFTQIVDWFGDNFEVVGYDSNEDNYYDIEVKVNTNSFIYWVLQYSGCVQVLGDNKNDDKNSFRNRVIQMLEDTLKKYKEDKECL